ncbi:Retrovirus-related Pol polyprotein from transposon TNT 1-94 [Araneus ventricosus]|uniref:Retrovirus-related Pol polyprotein from transposon TNT 1-94 n=1 Tax=Araneus ventricosus TaxID=182803 RepID=A0A4Y2CK58_ARAVE|nr:Retrovirus-related Pol polyprotein from transposon TNT 1-94 [Araneus ventricosus]
MTRASFKKIDRIYTKKPLELLHIDLWSSNVGPFYGQTRYMLTIVDDFSRYAWVLTLKNKNQGLKAFNTFKTEIEKQTNRIIRTVRTDNGLEFCSQIFEDDLKKAGIRHQRTNIYSPEMNGVAERLNRTMAEGVRCLRLESELPKGLWAELAYTFIYLKDRFPHKSRKGKIPCTLMYGKKCSVRHLKDIGSLAYVYVEKHKRDKLSFQSETRSINRICLKN